MRTQGVIMMTLLLVGWGCASKKMSVSTLIPTAPKFDQFPLDWIGAYEGPLVINSIIGKKDTVNMRLQISSPDAQGYYPWIISYGDEPPRYYGLEAINVSKGHYAIDEFNSIKISGFTDDNHFICRFNVMGSDLLVDYQRETEGIRVRFYISNSNPYNTTGGEVISQDTVPLVQSFEILVYQEAMLKEIAIKK